MSVTDSEHIPTEQETAIYNALSAGDLATIEQIRETAFSDKSETPGVSPFEQYNIDFYYAQLHYHSDHEMPEQQREENTVAQVEADNEEAPTLES